MNLEMLLGLGGLNYHARSPYRNETGPFPVNDLH